MAHGVTTAIKGVEPAGPHAVRHPAATEPRGRELRAGDHAVLPARHGRDSSVDSRRWTTFVLSWRTFVSHPPSVAIGAFQLTP
jgi:hypothetical protein